MLLFGSDPQHSQIEFGAHQVRDQAAKANLPTELQSALALIFEAKGLEFDDVFLFNFFADSPADERTWRVITGAGRSRTRPPTLAVAEDAPGRL